MTQPQFPHETISKSSYRVFKEKHGDSPLYLNDEFLTMLFTDRVATPQMGYMTSFSVKYRQNQSRELCTLVTDAKVSTDHQTLFDKKHTFI
jgi:hypothetical protein